MVSSPPEVYGDSSSFPSSCLSVHCWLASALCIATAVLLQEVIVGHRMKAYRGLAFLGMLGSTSWFPLAWVIWAGGFGGLASYIPVPLVGEGLGVPSHTILFSNNNDPSENFS